MGILQKPYFRGQSVHRLDAKGRLRIPTKFREVLQNHYTDALIVTSMEECLVAYPPEVWEKIESKVLELSQVQPDHRAFMRFFISSAEECVFDNQGRILLPPLLRKRASIGQEVLLAGLLDNFEIWSRAGWEEHLSSNRVRYQQIMNTIASTGL